MSINGIGLSIVAAVGLAALVQAGIDMAPAGSGLAGLVSVARSEIVALLPAPDAVVPESYKRLTMAMR